MLPLPLSTDASSINNNRNDEQTASVFAESGNLFETISPSARGTQRSIFVLENRERPAQRVKPHVLRLQRPDTSAVLDGTASIDSGFFPRIFFDPSKVCKCGKGCTNDFDCGRWPRDRSW